MYQILKGKTVAATTLGCKVNTYDTEAMVEILKSHGCTVVDFDTKADIYIVNTCTVTNLGDKKSRQALRKAYKLNPSAVIAACGCYSQVEPESVSSIEGVSLILGTKDRMRIAEFISQCMEGRKQHDFVSSISNEREFEDLTVSSMNEQTRAYLKIQEGCDRYCSYCIIPYARGPVRSRNPESVLAEANRLSQKGYKEIVLTGIHVAAYGKDIKETSLTDILKRVHAIEGIERIRLSSVEPGVITDEFLQAISNLNKVCEHFHLSLQSGSDRILKAMNRRYTSKEYEQAAQKIRQLMPDAGITTDVIVGFPGEGEAEFKESLDFLRQVKPSKVHVFPFSPKTGTKAALMENQISKSVKHERASIMSTLSESLSEEFSKSFINTNLSVLFEKHIGNNIYEGHSTNYITVRSRSQSPLENEVINLRIQSCQKNILYSE